MKNTKASKTLFVSAFPSLYAAICEAQTILVNYRLYDDVRILADTGRCLRVIIRNENSRAW